MWQIFLRKLTNWIHFCFSLLDRMSMAEVTNLPNDKENLWLVPAFHGTTKCLLTYPSLFVNGLERWMLPCNWASSNMYTCEEPSYMNWLTIWFPYWKLQAFKCENIFNCKVKIYVSKKEKQTILKALKLAQVI